MFYLHSPLWPLYCDVRIEEVWCTAQRSPGAEVLVLA